MVLVEILEDVLSKVFYLSNDIPSLVIFDVLVDIVTNPFQNFFSFLEAVDHLVDSLRFHLVVVEVDAEVSRKIEFTGEVPQYRLEESIDCLHPELIVMMCEQRQRLGGIFSDNCFLKPGLSGDLVEIRL